MNREEEIKQVAESIASMIYEVVNMCGINSDYVAKRIKEQARCGKE